MQKCLVTGASGFVGRSLMDRLSRNYEVTGVSFKQPGPGLISTDIRDADNFRKLLREAQPDIVVHAAAYPEPDYSEEHPAEARRVNVDTVRTLRDALPEVARLAFISSDYVFDGEKPPYREDSERQPVNAYGRMKMEAEDVLAGRPNTIIYRIALQVGEGKSQNRPGFIREMETAVRSGKEQLVDDVLIRFPTWTKDTAEGIAFLLGAGVSGTYHMSGPRGATRYFWTHETARILGLNADHIKSSKAVIQRKAPRPVDSQMLTDKIRALGYSHFTDFSDIVKNVLQRK